MKGSFTGVLLGLVWLFGFLSGVGFLITVAVIMNNKPVLHLVLPGALFVAGIAFGGFIIRYFAGKAKKSGKKK